MQHPPPTCSVIRVTIQPVHAAETTVFSAQQSLTGGAEAATPPAADTAACKAFEVASAVFGALFDAANATLDASTLDDAAAGDCSGGSDDAAVAAATSGEATGAREPSAGAGTDAGGALWVADVGPMLHQPSRLLRSTHSSPTMCTDGC